MRDLGHPRFALLVLVPAALAFGGWGLWRGDSANRIGAAIVLVAWCLSLALHRWGNFGGPELPVVIIDIVATLALIVLSFRSRRVWTLMASALQIATVASHFVAATIKHFPAGQADAARKWILGG